MNRSRFLSSGGLILLCLTGCTALPDASKAGPPLSYSRIGPSIDRLASAVRPEFERLAGAALTDWLASRERHESTPAHFKRRLVVNALKRPWEGLADLEQEGLVLAQLAGGGATTLPSLIDVLEAGMDRTSGFHNPVPFPTDSKLENLVAFMVDSIEQASRQRERALADLGETDRRFLFTHAQTMAEHFSPQILPVTHTMVEAPQADLRFAQLLEQRVDYGQLIGAAETLARLANEHWLRRLASVLTRPLPAGRNPPGVTGAVMMIQETAYGLIIVGGPGPNTYDVDHHVALVIDLGGNDQYRGLIAASVNEDIGNSVVIDLEGNDSYEGSQLGLATGRLGVGLLIDFSGEDRYQVEMGSGGAGFGGLGILFDAGGNDTYSGNRLTLGAAIGGLGLLFDERGNDRYDIPGFGIGFGGPLGVGALIDLSGDDSYSCGGRYPSAYNAQDAPDGKPGDPLFQYDCFGLGAGSGQRILSKREEWKANSLAGGHGLLLDIAGHDRYDSANFSQGLGYFFGAGVKLDLAGNDDHQAARYGHGASAHFGVGFFLDWDGDDRYGSTGPFYNGGVAWDYGVSLLIDAGEGRDIYAFARSTGLGRADHNGWGLFIDEGGADQYETPSGFGESSEKGVAAFFDLDGADVYASGHKVSAAPQPRPKNGTSFLYRRGGLFVDR